MTGWCYIKLALNKKGNKIEKIMTNERKSAGYKKSGKMGGLRRKKRV
jgi:hypothetical protein